MTPQAALNPCKIQTFVPLFFVYFVFHFILWYGYGYTLVQD